MLRTTELNSHARVPSSATRYVRTMTGFFMVLEDGDNIFQQLEGMMKAEEIPAATISGIGFGNFTFGYFDFEKKDYQPKVFEEVELAAMVGSLAWQHDNPSIHIHGVITRSDFTAHGGHMLEGVVSKGTVEITIIVHNEKFERIKDKAMGANVLCLRNCRIN